MFEASNSRNRGETWRTVVPIAALLFGVFGLTASKLYFGYEGANIAQAEGLVRGDYSARVTGGIDPYTQGGALEVAAYFPFTILKLTLEHFSALPGLRQLAYTFALPLYTVLLCLLFYGLALTLYKNRIAPIVLTLLLAFTTMIWPYAKFGMETWQTMLTIAAVWALLAWKEEGKCAAAIGFGFAIAGLMLTKITGPLHAAALVVAAIWLIARERRLWQRSFFVRHAAVATLIAGAGAALFLFTNRWRYGGWLWEGRYGMSAELTPFPVWEALWAVLFSPGESLFLFSPTLILGFWFWSAFWRRFKSMRPIMVLMLLLALFHLHNRPWADETWGPRRLHYLVPLLILPVGIWLERLHELRPCLRRLGLLVIAFGAWVQFAAVSFDYTAHAKILGNTPLYAQESTIWDPQLSPLRFNVHLAGSALHRMRAGESIPFIYERHYLPWTAPPEPPAPFAFDVSGFDHLDLWYLQQQADWPDRPYWFRSISSLLVPIFAIFAIAGAALLGGALRSPNPIRDATGR